MHGHESAPNALGADLVPQEFRGYHDRVVTVGRGWPEDNSATMTVATMPAPAMNSTRSNMALMACARIVPPIGSDSWLPGSVAAITIRIQSGIFRVVVAPGRSRGRHHNCAKRDENGR